MASWSCTPVMDGSGNLLVKNASVFYTPMTLGHNMRINPFCQKLLTSKARGSSAACQTFLWGVMWLAMMLAPSFCLGQNCIAPPSGLVSWWAGDGSADDVIGGNGGTLLGGVTFSSGMVGGTFSFDGQTGHIRV